MVLWIAEQGPLCDVVASAAGGADGAVAVASPGDDDLFSRAAGKEGIVYLPTPILLDGLLDPRPDVERARAAVAASRAPGVGVIVMVVPRGEGYAPEELVLRREGRPYVILRAPVLFEEAAFLLRREGDKTVWLPRQGKVAAMHARDLLAAVDDALRTEEQGRTVEVPGETVSVADLFRREAHAVGHSVHAVPPLIHRVCRPVMRALLGREPAALSLADRLTANPAAS